MALICPPDRTDATATLPLGPRDAFITQHRITTSRYVRLLNKDQRRRSVAIKNETAAAGGDRVWLALVDDTGQTERRWPLDPGEGIVVTASQVELYALADAADSTLYVFGERD